MKPLLIFFTLVLSSTMVSAQRKHLLFDGDVNDGTLKKFAGKQQAYDNLAQVVSDSVNRKGNKSIRFEVKSSNILGVGNKGIRSEFSFDAETNPERWYGLSIFAPNSYLPDPEPEIVTQWHNSSDVDLGEKSISPSISLWVQNGHWNLHVMWDTARVTRQGAWMGIIQQDFGVVKLNAWTDWVFHIKFSYKADGLIEVYRNGIKILSRKGPNDFNDKILPYWKVGIYKWVFADHMAEHHKYNERVLFFSSIRKGDEHATYKDVAP